QKQQSTFQNSQSSSANRGTASGAKSASNANTSNNNNNNTGKSQLLAQLQSPIGSLNTSSGQFGTNNQPNHSSLLISPIKQSSSPVLTNNNSMSISLQRPSLPLSGP